LGYVSVVLRTSFWFFSLAAEKPHQKMEYDYVGEVSMQLGKLVVKEECGAFLLATQQTACPWVADLKRGSWANSIGDQN